MEWINFRQLYAFWMVSRHGGFKRAADKMFVSQSAVSDHVAQLEDYLGEKLFDRTTRKIHLTRSGTHLMRYAESIFAQSREINQVFKDKKEAGAPQSIRIGMVGGISRNFVFRSLTNMFNVYDDLKIEVVNGSFDELYMLLRSYELGILISAEVPQRKGLASLAYSSIGSSALCLAGQRKLMERMEANSLAAGEKTSFDIFNYRFPYEGDLVEDVLVKRMKLKVKARLETDDISLLRFFANSGQGLVVIPEVGVHEDVNKGRIIKKRLERLPKVHFYAIYLKDGIHREMIDRLF